MSVEIERAKAEYRRAIRNEEDERYRECVEAIREWAGDAAFELKISRSRDPQWLARIDAPGHHPIFAKDRHGMENACELLVMVKYGWFGWSWDIGHMTFADAMVRAEKR